MIEIALVINGQTIIQYDAEALKYTMLFGGWPKDENGWYDLTSHQPIAILNPPAHIQLLARETK